MSRLPNTVRVGSVYYARKRVPADLEKVLKKREIRISLKTKDRREASRLLSFEIWKIEAQFDEARKKVDASQPVVMVEISDSEAVQLVSSWFVELERESEKWWESEGQNLPPESILEIQGEVREDAAALQASPSFQADDGAPHLDKFLTERRLEVPKNSEAYKRLLPLFRRGVLEHSLRVLDRIDRRAASPHDSLFRDLFAHSQTLPPAKVHTLEDLLSDFTSYHEKASSPGTQTTYQIPIRLLREVFGNRKRLSEIEPQQMKEFFDLLEQAPKNAKQRYPGKNLKAAIAAADKAGDQERLRPKTLANYYRNVVAIFNFAKEMGMVESNPASNRMFRNRFEVGDDDETVKALFSIDELNKLFRAPLYTGCVDDERGYNVKGTNIVRRGRFWAPLVALFHGCRENEICQLHSEDVKCEDGLWFISIRTTLDDKSKSGKRLKTVGSRRRVPIHRELVSMGFLEYVKSRQSDPASPRLFPDLPVGVTGYHSGPFSKWFGRFVEKAVPESDATFHSFRHMWRTALVHEDVAVADAEAMGGWGGEGRSSEKTYNHGQLLSKLKVQIDKVQYPGLDLSHLHKEPRVRFRPPQPEPTTV